MKQTKNSILIRVLVIMLCVIMLAGTMTSCFVNTDDNGGVIPPVVNPPIVDDDGGNDDEENKDAGIEEEKDPSLVASVTIEEGALIYGALANGIVIGAIDSYNAMLPADVKIAEGASSVALSVKEVETGSEVVLGEDDTAHSLDVHIEGIAADNTVPMIVNLGAVLEAGLSKTELKLYHMENGTAVLMTRVDSLNDFAIHNQYYYNAETGEVSIYVASFSVFTAVQTTAEEWDGTSDTTWYNDNDTSFILTTAEQFAGFRDLVDGGNTFEGKTITLGVDIDLMNKLFDPIGFGYYKDEKNTEDGDTNTVFLGTFDGGNHTIYNLYQNCWELDTPENNYATYTYSTAGAGLFASVKNATIKNLAISGAEVVFECVDMGVLVGYAQGVCHFENIVITNANIANYNRYTGGLVGEVSYGPYGIDTSLGYSHTFKNITIDSSVKVSGLWGSFGCGMGGVIGGKWGDATVKMENVVSAAEMDVYNDVVSAYQWYAFRGCGMLIGHTEEPYSDGRHSGIATASFLTCENVDVYYGDWVNYTYYEFKNQENATGQRYPWVRAEAGEYCDAFSNIRYGVPTHGGVKVSDLTEDELKAVATDYTPIIFNQLYGADRGMYGQAEHEGVTVINKNTKTIYIKNNLGWENLKLHYWFKHGEDTWTNIDNNGVALTEENGVYRVDIPAYAYGFKIVADDGESDTFVLANIEDKSNVNLGIDPRLVNLKAEVLGFKDTCKELETDLAGILTVMTEHESICTSNACVLKEGAWDAYNELCNDLADLKHQIEIIDAKIYELENAEMVDTQEIELLEAAIETIKSEQYYGGSIIKTRIEVLEAYLDESLHCHITSVEIPDDATSIEDYQFYEYSSITSVTIPNSVISIGRSAFENCTSLTSITIPDSVTNIAERAFDNCTSLKNINFTGTKEQWNAINKGSNWNSYTDTYVVFCTDGNICTTHTEVTDEAVAPTCTATGLTEGKHCEVCGEVFVAQDVIDMVDHDFVDGACQYCGLNPRLVNLKAEVLGVKNDICKALEYDLAGILAVITEHETICESSACALYEKGIKDGYNGIYNDLANLKQQIEIIDARIYELENAERVDSQEIDVLENAIYEVYSQGSGIKTIISVLETSIDASLHCHITSVEIPDGITSIEDGQFRGYSSITSVTIPNSVISIEDNAFDDCTSLTSITIPNSVTNIGELAFHNCTSLKDINFTGTKEQWNAISKASNWDYGTGTYTIDCTDGNICKTHSEVIDKAVAPTCTATGLTEGKHCSVCNEVLVAQTVVAANGHKYDNDCDTTCNTCGATRTVGDHNWVEYNCSICGEKVETETIYFQNNWKWTSLSIHFYKDTTISFTISGSNLTSKKEPQQVGGYDVYKLEVPVYVTAFQMEGYDATTTTTHKTEKVSSKNIVDGNVYWFVYANGKYAIASNAYNNGNFKTHDIYVVGSMNGWSTTNMDSKYHLTASADGKTWTISITFDVTTQIKLYNTLVVSDGATDAWVNGEGYGDKDVELAPGTYTITYSVANNTFTFAMTSRILYLKAGGWDKDNARFAAYVWYYEGSTKKEAWYSMTKQSDGSYKVTIPDEYVNVIFCRMNGSNTTNNWNNKWNQTGDLRTGDGSVFEINTSSGWDNQTTGWSKK